jgi:hypothetical protein
MGSAFWVKTALGRLLGDSGVLQTQANSGDSVAAYKDSDVVVEGPGMPG